MRNNFLEKYKDEFQQIYLTTSKKKKKVSKATAAQKEILNYIMRNDIYDKNSDMDSIYIPVHAAIFYIPEQDRYDHLFFIFNINKLEVFNVIMSSVMERINDSEITKNLNCLSEELFFRINNVSKYLSLKMTKLINKIQEIMPPVDMTFSKSCAGKMKIFFHIINAEDMMVLFGYYLYTAIFQSDIPKGKYSKFIINPVYNPQSISTKQIDCVLAMLNYIFYGTDQINKHNYFHSEDISNHNILSEKFEKIKDEYMTIANISQISKKSDISNLIQEYFDYRDYDSENGMIIFSKRRIESKRTLDILFANLNANNLIVSKDFEEYLYKLIIKFKKYSDEKFFRDSSIRSARSVIEEYEEYIYSTSILTIDDCKKYAPIVFALQTFFVFLREESYISSNEYNELIVLTKNIYEQFSQIPNTGIVINSTKEISQVLINAVYVIYREQSNLFSNQDATTPFIYDKCRQAHTLICFHNIDDVISFVKKHSGILPASMQLKFSEIIEGSDNSLYKVKDFLIKERIIKTNRGRKALRIKKYEYLALDTEKIYNIFLNSEYVNK